MKTILKYPLSGQMSSHMMTKEARPLSAQMQNGYPQLWVECDDEYPMTSTRYFFTIGTGQAVPKNGRYVSTMIDGNYVWHIYEVPAPGKGEFDGN